MNGGTTAGPTSDRAFGPQSGLRAGFARRDITPPPGAPLSGFVVRTRPAAGVHDPLHARALALAQGDARACLLALDLIGVDAELTRDIRAEVARRGGLPEGALAVCATHTHGGPAVLARSRLGEPPPGYRAELTRRAADAVLAALADLAPCTLGVARGRQLEVARNRRLPGGPIDPDVPVAAFRRDGRLVGLLASYACHPVVLGPDNHLVTRDYPGMVVDALEARAEQPFACFVTGCCGEINHGHHAHDSLRSGPSERRSFAEAARLAGLIADEAWRAADRAAPEAPEDPGAPAGVPLRTARARVRLPYGPLPSPPRDDLARWRRERRELAGSDAARGALLDTLIRWAETRPEAPPDDEEVELMAIAAGRLLLLLLPGEVFAETGLALKAAIASRAPRCVPIVVGCALAAPGYLPPRSAFADGGYEVAEAFRFYGRPAPFAPEAAERLEAAARDLATEVLEVLR